MSSLRSVAFGGAFFAWPYHAGVAAYLQERGEPVSGAQVIGTSSGAVIATMLACGIEIATTGLELGLRADRVGLGGRKIPFFQPRAFLEPHVEEMDRALPADAHIRATDRLVVTVRPLRAQLRQTRVERYATRAELLDALAAAVAVPGLTVPLYHPSPRLGPCLDGGPGVPDDPRPGVATVRVGVFERGRYDIRPRPALTWAQLLAVPPDSERRALFAAGRRDAAAFYRGAR